MGVGPLKGDGMLLGEFEVGGRLLRIYGSEAAVPAEHRPYAVKSGVGGLWMVVLERAAG